MLLSEDGRDTFLCDFGHAERLDKEGQSLSGSKGKHIVAFRANVEEVVIHSHCFTYCSFQSRSERFRDPHGP